MASEDFGPFGRRSVDRDDFDDMREQMARERDKFFRETNPRDWQRETTGPARQGHFTLVGHLEKKFPCDLVIFPSFLSALIKNF